MVQRVTDFGVEILVSDPSLRFHNPGLRSWKSGHRFGYIGFRFSVTDSAILVSDPGLRSWSPIRTTPPKLRCFVHFHFDMYFAPQRRALFRHLNFQKSSEHGVLCTFLLPNVLRATTACTFSTSQLPKVVRTWCVLYMFTSKCASRHNGAHFFNISTSKSAPSMWCFSAFYFKMCFASQRRATFHLPSGQLPPHPPL